MYIYDGILKYTDYYTKSYVHYMYALHLLLQQITSDSFTGM